MTIYKVLVKERRKTIKHISHEAKESRRGWYQAICDTILRRKCAWESTSRGRGVYNFIKFKSDFDGQLRGQGGVFKYFFEKIILLFILIEEIESYQ